VAHKTNYMIADTVADPNQFKLIKIRFRKCQLSEAVFTLSCRVLLGVTGTLLLIKIVI